MAQSAHESKCVGASKDEEIRFAESARKDRAALLGYVLQEKTQYWRQLSHHLE